MKYRRSEPYYTWQREDWPNFEWNSQVLLDPLSDLNGKIGLLTGRMASLGFAKKNLASTKAMSDELLASSAIEGEVINANSVRSSIARRLGIESDGTFSDDHYVEGLVDVMFDAVNNPFKPLDEDRIFGWHAALFPTGRSGMYKISVGEWRSGPEPMQVVSGAFGREKVHFQAPDSDIVPGEMKKLMEWCNETSTNPVVAAAVAHFWFVTIHPFDDGNGRIGRTLAEMMLARLDKGQGRFYSMSAEINRNKKEYYEILEVTQHGDLNITPWILWFIRSIDRAVQRSLDSIKTIIEKSDFWDRFREIEINERQRKVLNRVWDDFEGKLTTSKWAKICHCSQDTALRDIQDLIGKGMIIESPEGGRSKNYLLPHNSGPMVLLAGVSGVVH